MVKCQQAFEDLKDYLSSLPLLSLSKSREELFLYLVVSLVPVSAALIKKEDQVQKPVYYTNRALRGTREVPAIGKTCFHFGYSSPQAHAIFSSPHDNRPD